MASIKQIGKQYLNTPLFDRIEKAKEEATRLSNNALILNVLPESIDPKDHYPHVVFIENVLDSEVNYTMLYNAKVGTIVPIKKSDLSNLKDCWVECAGQTVLKSTYPMLYNVIGNRFYNTDILDEEIPVYTDEFVLPKIARKKLNSVDNDEIVFVIKTSSRVKGNHYDTRDNIV